MAQAAAMDITVLDSDAEDTPEKNVARVQQYTAGRAVDSPAPKRRCTLLQVQRCPTCSPPSFHTACHSIAVVFSPAAQHGRLTLLPLPVVFAAQPQWWMSAIEIIA